MNQNTESWESWRLTGIGSSDAPIIMEASPYLKPDELLDIKLGKAKYEPNSYITELGHRFEPRAIAHINIMTGKLFKPQLVEMAEYSWLRASLDGKYQNETLEAKYVGAKKFQKAKEEGIVCLDHWIQMQHQMMVCGTNEAIYLCYTLDENKKDIDEIHWHQVPYDKEYVLNELWPAEFHFWERVMRG